MTPRTVSPRRLTAAVATLALVAALLVSIVGATPASAATTVKVTNNTTIRCAFANYSTPTDWYFPTTGTPRGLIWLQHGFSENKGHWSTYAPKLAAAGYVVFATTLPTADIFGCTVQNVGNKTFFRRSDRWVDSTATEEQEKNVKQIRRFSPEYFELAAKHGRDARRYLAMDGQITIVLDGVAYQIDD